MNQAKAFAKRLSAVTDRLDSKLKAFLSNQGPANVHELRTTIRRVEASFELLPKSLRRKPKTAAYITRSKALFKATSAIRDIDIIEGKLRKFESISGVRELLAAKAEKRSQLLRAALRAANALKQTSAPNFKASQISESKLSKRKKKVAKKYEDRLESQIGTMLSNPTPEQLHDFRKSCKMLRYTLEIDSKKKDKHQVAIEELQTILGSVMDDFTTLQCVSESSLGEAATSITGELNTSKEKAYNHFVTVLKRNYAPKPKNASAK